MCQGRGRDHQGACGTPVFVIEFTKEEARLSSAWRELVALCDLYVEMGEKWKGRSIFHLTYSSDVEAKNCHIKSIIDLIN